MTDVLNLTLYGRLGDKPQLVLRKKNVLYRMPNLQGVRAAECKLRRFGYELDLGVPEPLVLNITSTKCKEWLLETGLSQGTAMLCVYAHKAGKLKVCFEWKGEKQELANALKKLRY